jgi:glycosyltransferase involved in cell wall biosynthesis
MLVPHAAPAEEEALTGRLVIVVLNFPAPEDRRVWALATAAARSGRAVTVVSPALRGHPPGQGHVDGVDLLWFRAFEGTSAVGAVLEALLSTTRASRLVRSLRPSRGDVVHVCTPPDSLSRLLRWARRRGAATLYDQHDVVPLLAASKRAHRPFVPLYRAMERATVRNASVVVTAGQVQADRLHDLYGTEALVVRTAAPLLPVAHVPPERATVLGYLGVLGQQDGVEGLLRAIGVLRDQGRRDVVLRIAGDGPELAALQELREALQLQDQVEFLGWLDESGLEAFLDEVHGFVVPDPLSDFNHTCPMLKVSHALGAGLPTVMTPLRENLAITGGHAFVSGGDSPAALAEAITRWLDSGVEERRQQGEALRARWREELHPDRHLARYVDAVGAATEGRRPPAPSPS